MTPEQALLIEQAQDSLQAAQLLQKEGYPGFAASRAYYAMFYVAEALLLGKGLVFSKHAGVLSAFGEHFAKTGIAPPEMHRYLIEAMEVRHLGDYAAPKSVTLEDSSKQIERAGQFLELARKVCR